MKESYKDKIIHRKKHKASFFNLFDEWLIFEVWTADAEIEDVHPLHNGVVERVQEPGRVRHLLLNQKYFTVLSSDVRSLLLTVV